MRAAMRLTFVFALVVSMCFVLGTAACGAAKTCSPQSCATGCCSATGECVGGAVTSACGSSGDTCVDCALTSQVCGNQVCIAAPVEVVDAGVDAGTPFVCARSAVTCSDQAIAELGLFANMSTGAVTNAADTTGFVATVDTRAGGVTATESYVYAKFGELGLEKLALSDMTALDSMDWDIAFRRFVIRINSGNSGPSCVGAQLQTAPYDNITFVPANFVAESDDFLSKTSCALIPDGSGLTTSPRTALASFYRYDSCVAMTGNAFVIRSHTGRHLKLVVSSYYAAGQDGCNTAGTPGTMGGTMKVRWQYLD